MKFKDLDEKDIWKEIEAAKVAAILSIGVGLVNFAVLLAIIYTFGKVAR